MSERPVDEGGPHLIPVEPTADDDDDEAPPAAPAKRGSVAADRHRGRRLALQALYEADAAGHDPAVTVERLSEEEQASAAAAAFARALVAGIKRTRADLDAEIRQAAPQWPLEQLAVVDRNVLRIAIYELLVEAETPVRVAVNEAVELAKTFGTDASARFVNGVLGAISARRPE